MLTSKLRPKTLGDVTGQPLAVGILRKFVQNPGNSPNCLLFHGTYGTGKTSSARAFAHELNGASQPDDRANYITEFNCASLEHDLKNSKSVEDFLGWRLMTIPDKWDVVIFDEIQGASVNFQTGLLTFIEKTHSKQFFVFCTTDINSVIDTLRSRCMPVEFKAVGYDDICMNLGESAKVEGIALPAEIKSLIAVRSNGHMRDAHMELQKYLSLGEQDYTANVFSYYAVISEMFIAAYKGNKGSMLDCLSRLSHSPLPTIKKEFESFVIDCANAKYLGKNSSIGEVNSLLNVYGDDFMSLINFYTGIWDNSLFGSDRHF